MSRSNDATLLADLLRQAGLEDFAPNGPVLPASQETRLALRDPRPSIWSAWGIPGKAIRLLERPVELKDRESLQAARALLEASRSGRVWGLLVGGVGAGKSTAAGWWLVNVPSRGGCPRMYVRSQDVAALPEKTVWAEERIQRLCDAGALVIDDVGRKDAVSVVDPESGKGRSVIHPNVQRVLDARYDNRRPVLCTSNLHPVRDWLPYLEDERARDRWREVGVARASREPSLRGRRGEP